MMILKRTTSDSNSFKILTGKLDNELKAIYGYTQEEFEQFNIINNLETVVIAYVNNNAAGCGCFKIFKSDTVQLKRIFVDAPYRGKGVAAAILNELETWAKEMGFTSVVLETGTLQPEAIDLYKKHGYQTIPNFSPYIGNELSVCMKKNLIVSK